VSAVIKVFDITISKLAAVSVGKVLLTLLIYILIRSGREDKDVSILLLLFR
jgi:hypothetical protein